MAGYFGFTLDVPPSLRQSYVRQYFVSYDNLCKRQWIFAKFGMCIDIVEIQFGIANGQILTELSAPDTPIFSCPDKNLSKCQEILTKHGTCIDI